MPQVRARTPRLTQQQVRFLDAYSLSRNGVEAAKSVGYSQSSASQMAKRTLANPKAIEYLRSLQSESRAIAAYDLSLAMQESLEVIAFAKEHKNAMAYFKAVEHRAKLSGLLIDRVQVATVDITGALDEARRRIVTIPNLSLPELPEVKPERSVEQNSNGGGGPGGGGGNGLALG